MPKTRRFKASRYSFVFSNGIRHAIYHSILQHIVYLDSCAKEVFSLFAGGSSTEEALLRTPLEHHNTVASLIELLRDKGLLVPEDVSEPLFGEALRKHATVDIKLMYLVITDACNLRCRYCYIENAFPSTYVHKHMDTDTARKAVTLFMNVSRPKTKGTGKRRIIFYGGEPLLNISAFEASVLSIRSHPEAGDVEIILITNGVAMTEKIAAFITKHKVKVSLSIDGPEQIHDAARPNQNGQGTFKQVCLAYNMLKRAGMKRVSLSVTIGRHNVVNLVGAMEELLRLFYVEAIGFNFLIDFPDCENPLSIPIEQATDSVLATFEYLRTKGIYEDRIMRKLKPFVNNTFHFRDCGGIGNQIVIAPDGKIGPCQAFVPTSLYFNHHVDEGILDFSSDPVYQEWSTRMPVYIDECYKCPAIAVCGGGCPYQAHIKTGSIWNLDERMCIHNRAFIEWAIWDAAKKTPQM